MDLCVVSLQLWPPLNPVKLWQSPIFDSYLAAVIAQLCLLLYLFRSLKLDMDLFVVSLHCV